MLGFKSFYSRIDCHFDRVTCSGNYLVVKHNLQSSCQVIFTFIVFKYAVFSVLTHFLHLTWYQNTNICTYIWEHSTKCKGSVCIPIKNQPRKVLRRCGVINTQIFRKRLTFYGYFHWVFTSNDEVYQTRKQYVTFLAVS